MEMFWACTQIPVFLKSALILFIGVTMVSQGKLFQIPLAPMGVLAPGSAHARPSAQTPIDMSGNFPAHVSAESPSKFSKKN